ncbi:MAG TPA: cysteine desulfurase NifS [Bacteroidetes bacterium]|nr:cysteine desulfurase NifS [Bacteroidota bacterium]
MPRSIYLDNAATTPVDPRVLEAMIPYYTDVYGNANSPHGMGRRANVAVEDAREMIAKLIGAQPSEIIFTSGGTESNNAAIKGVLKATGKKHVITSRVEHHAVLHPIQHAYKDGIKASYLDVKPLGFVTAQQVDLAITDETALVTLMHGNNEISSINPIAEISKVCRNKGILFHSDTVQTTGKIPVHVDDLGVDFLSISGHKIYGPKGVGILYVRNGSTWSPWMEGGSQERRRRGGTLNVPGIIGLAKAMELSITEMDANKKHISNLKSMLVSGLREKFADIVSFNGDVENGLYNIVNCSFPLDGDRSLDGEMLLLNLDIEGICCSNGSACSSGTVEASHVLMALGMVTPTAKSSLRFSIGKQNTEDDIAYTLEKLEFIVNRMKNTSMA